MSRWNRIRRWSLAGCLALGLGAWGIWSLESTSDAGDRVVQGSPIVHKDGSTRDLPADKAAANQPESAPTMSVMQGLGSTRQAVPAFKSIAQAAKKEAAGQEVQKNEPGKKAAVAQKPAPQDLLGKLKAVKEKAIEKKDFPPEPLMNIAGNQAFQGVMNINGQQFQTNDPEEFRKLMQQNQGLFGQFPPGRGVKSFQGVMNINGVEQKFDDPDEFTEAAIGADLPLLPGFQIP